MQRIPRILNKKWLEGKLNEAGALPKPFGPNGPLNSVYVKLPDGTLESELFDLAFAYGFTVLVREHPHSNRETFVGVIEEMTDEHISKQIERAEDVLFS